MDPLGPLPRDFSDIQADPATMRYCSKLINGVSAYDPTAGNFVRYLGELISLKCAPDMLAMKLFPNAKEISESFAAYEAARHRLDGFDLGDPAITVVVVGDGSTPRTAATFAFRSAWVCHSIDPLLKGGTLRWANIKRLTLHPTKVEDVEPIVCDKALIVAVHSHAKLQNAILAVKAPHTAVIAMPCCVAQKLSVEPDRRYRDKSVISPAREVLIWQNIAGIPEYTQPRLWDA